MTELRDPEATASWLAAGLALSHVPRPPTREALTLFTVVMAERPGLPPAGCVLELAALAVGGAATRFTPRAPGDDALRHALRAWEDVLGRIAGDRRLTAVQDAVLALPEPLRPEAAALFASLVLARLAGAVTGGGAELAVIPGAVRRTLESGTDIPPGAVDSARLCEGYERLVAAARTVPELLGPGDAFLLAWLERLRSLEARVLLQELASVADETELPRRVRSLRRRGQAASRIEEESAYPVGGFASISTSGAIENLVTSELAYMSTPESGDGAGEGGDVDLFDLRWAEGELLYYSRDEGALHRERRAILVELDPELVSARRAGPGGRQHLVLILGRLVAVLRRCVELLGEVELHVLLAVGGGRPRALELELDLLQLLLLDLTQRQILEVGRRTREELAAWLVEQGKLGAVDRVVVTVDGREPAPPGGGRALARLATLVFRGEEDAGELLRRLV